MIVVDDAYYLQKQLDMMVRNSLYGKINSHSMIIRPISLFNGPQRNLFAAASFEHCLKNVENIYEVPSKATVKIDIVIKTLLTYVPGAHINIRRHRWTDNNSWLTIGMDEDANANYNFFKDIIDNEITEEFDNYEQNN